MKTTKTSSLLSQTTLLLTTAIGAASFALLAGAEAATALTIFFDSTSTSTNNPPTGASAEVDFSFTDGTGGVQLDLTLTNTTNQLDTPFGEGATDSEFVAFGFDLPSLISSYTYDNLGSPFTRLFGDASLNATVEGDALINGAGGQNEFDIGIRVPGTGGNPSAGGFQGGNPNGGLNPEESTLVSFFLDTTSNAQQVEEAFKNLFNGEEFRAVARFQAVDGPGFSGASDKLLVNTLPEDGGGDSTKVPEPASLAGLALVGAALAGARRRHSH